MSDQSNNLKDFDGNIQSILTILVDNEGIVQYNCDWAEGDEGLIAMASIFYKILVDNLPMQILEEIKEQCVLNGKEGDYMALVSLINNNLDDTPKEEDVDNDICIPPDQIFNI